MLVYFGGDDDVGGFVGGQLFVDDCFVFIVFVVWDLGVVGVGGVDEVVVFVYECVEDCEGCIVVGCLVEYVVFEGQREDVEIIVVDVGYVEDNCC